MTGAAPAALKPPPPTVYRWAVLVVISLAMFGNYFFYDLLAPVADLLDRQLGMADAEIGLLRTMYSTPNIIMVVIGGVIIDRVGVKRATLLFGTLCFAGAAIATASGALAVMAGGWLIFGVGAESLIVSVTTAIARWFKGRELSFAFGLNLTIARAGSYAAKRSPSWAGFAFDDWRYPLLIGVLVTSLCVAGALAYWVLESRAERRYRIGAIGGTDKVVFRDLFTFPRSYVWVVLLCVTFYSAVFPFETFAIKFFQEAHGTTRGYAGELSGIITLFAVFCTPAFGYLVDRVGKRSLFMMFGSLLLVPVYMMMAYTRVPLVVPMAMMGVSFSLVPAVMWPSVAYLVDERRLGTAYGVMTMIQNVGLAGFNYVVGMANDLAGAGPENPGGYAAGMWIFSILGFLGLLFAAMLRRSETGPGAHGLETITVASSQQGA